MMLRELFSRIWYNYLSATAGFLTENATQEEIFRVWKTEPNRVLSIKGLNENRGYSNGTP
jgi:hypothetical protein